MADRQDYVEQIMRDLGVLAGDPAYHMPSREFYEQRIEAMNELLARESGSKPGK